MWYIIMYAYVCDQLDLIIHVLCTHSHFEYEGPKFYAAQGLVLPKTGPGIGW